MSQDSEEVVFIMEGRLIKIDRFRNETSEYFAERASFLLTFRNDPELFETAKILSFYHCNKIFKGVVYSPNIEEMLVKFRKVHRNFLRE